MRIYSLWRKAWAVLKTVRHLHHYRIAVVVWGWVTVEASLILIWLHLFSSRTGPVRQEDCAIYTAPKQQHLWVVGEIFYAECSREINWVRLPAGERNPVINCSFTFTATIQEIAERRVQSKMVSQARLIKDWVVLDILQFKVRVFPCTRASNRKRAIKRKTSSTSWRKNQKWNWCIGHGGKMKWPGNPLWSVSSSCCLY